MRFLVQAFSIVLFGAGVFFFVTAVYPILSYELFVAPKFKKVQLLSPVEPKVAAEEGKKPYPLDLTRASNWFIDQASEEEFVAEGVKYYTVSIPKLKIKDAAAEIGGDDLAKNLIHYRGTALPGRAGNAVVFGHSVLPQFFDPENYLTIFSNLPRLKVGDEVIVSYDGITYRYKVEDMFEVMPEDIQVLEQRYDDSYITLVTCVPPGTYLRRLVARGRLIPPGATISQN